MRTAMLRVLVVAFAAAGPASRPADAHAQAPAKIAPKQTPARPPGAASTGGMRDSARAALLAGLVRGDRAGLEELVSFAPAGPRVAISLASAVAAPPGRVVAMLADPASFQRAVPAFVRADIVAGAGQPGGARLVDWELEISLWNLAGQLWLRPMPDGAILELARGDLLPGRLELQVIPRGAGATLVVSGDVNLKSANWVTRRLARRDPMAEPAMSVTALYVLLRALAVAADADRAGSSIPRRPRAGMRAPAVGAIDPGDFVTRLAAPPVPGQTPGQTPGQIWARVVSRPDGRLDRVELALPVANDGQVAVRVREPARWRALPGWSAVTEHPGKGAEPTRWEVDAGLPFVDFDAIWTLTRERPLRAEARGGDWTGAVMGVDVLERSGGPATLVFTSHPRVDRVGFIPRRLIEAEPLLEHGLALGLGFVNATALVGAVAR